MTNQEQIVERPLSPQTGVIIVGASSGFGAALAQEAAARGFQLALFSRRQDRLRALAEEIRQEHDVKVFTYAHDVKDTEEVPALLQSAMRDLGGLNYFIYNSGIMFQQGANRFEPADEVETLEVNLVGAAAWLMPVADRFVRAGEGHIVGVGSIAGERGRAGLPAYSASKAGLHTYLEALRNRVSRHGVVVTTLKPGQIETEMLKRAAKIRGPIPADRAAYLAWQAILARKQIAFIPGRWRWVGLIVRNIPSFLFRRMNL
jgi:short-subunit dehydrogenase